MEEKKSQEELGRLSEARQAYLQMMQLRVKENIEIEDDLIHTAKIHYEAIKAEKEDEELIVNYNGDLEHPEKLELKKQEKGDPGEVIDECPQFLDLMERDEKEF